MPTRLPKGFRTGAEVVIKRSRFIATVARVDDETAARDVIAQVRADHPAARHHCSAFIVEEHGAQPVERSSDDGEPSGTAGMPMLDVLRATGMTQLVAVVTRYFGGVLLGTGGLVRAYTEATAAALEGTPRVQPVTQEVLGLTLPPAEVGRVEGALLAKGEHVITTDWDVDIAAGVLLHLATSDPERTRILIQELLQRRVLLSDLGARTIELPVTA